MALTSEAIRLLEESRRSYVALPFAIEASKADEWEQTTERLEVDFVTGRFWRDCRSQTLKTGKKQFACEFGDGRHHTAWSSDYPRTFSTERQTKYLPDALQHQINLVFAWELTHADPNLTGRLTQSGTTQDIVLSGGGSRGSSTFSFVGDPPVLAAARRDSPGDDRVSMVTFTTGLIDVVESHRPPDGWVRRAPGIVASRIRGYEAPDSRSCPAVNLGEPVPPVVADVFQGARPTVVHFWATYCGRCRQRIHLLKELSDQFGTGITCMAVSRDGAGESAGAFLAKRGYDFPALWDRDLTLSHHLGVSGTPSTFLLAGGRLQAVLGDLEWDWMTGAIGHLLEDQGER